MQGIEFREKTVREWKSGVANFRPSELSGLLNLCKRNKCEEFREQTSLYFSGKLPMDSKVTGAQRLRAELRFNLGVKGDGVGVVVAIEEKMLRGYCLFILNDAHRTATILCLLVDEAWRKLGIGTELVRRTQVFVSPYCCMMQFDKNVDCNLTVWKQWAQKLGFNRARLCEELGLYVKSRKQYAMVVSATVSDLRKRYLSQQESKFLQETYRPSDEESRNFMGAALKRFETALARHFPKEA